MVPGAAYYCWILLRDNEISLLSTRLSIAAQSTSNNYTTFSKNRIIFQRTASCLLLFPFLSSPYLPKMSVSFQAPISVFRSPQLSPGVSSCTPLSIVIGPVQPAIVSCLKYYRNLLTVFSSPILLSLPHYWQLLSWSMGSVIYLLFCNYLWLSIASKIQMPQEDILDMTFGPNLLS